MLKNMFIFKHNPHDEDVSVKLENSETNNLNFFFFFMFSFFLYFKFLQIYSQKYKKEEGFLNCCTLPAKKTKTK